MDQIKDKINSVPAGQIVAARFGYNGKPRIVDNITWDNEHSLVVGFEMREVGRFSYQVKKFSADKIEGEFEIIDAPVRVGPAIGRP